MDQQREWRIGREISAPVHDELLSAWIEVSFSKWRRVDGVEELPQLGDAHIDDLAFPRDGISSGGRSAFMSVVETKASLLRVPRAGPCGPS